MPARTTIAVDWNRVMTLNFEAGYMHAVFPHAISPGRCSQSRIFRRCGELTRLLKNAGNQRSDSRRPLYYAGLLHREPYLAGLTLGAALTVASMAVPAAETVHLPVEPVSVNGTVK